MIKSLGAACAVVLLSSAAPSMAAELLTNGNFETGTFAGWTVTGSSGTFYIDTPGTTTPASSFTMPANGAGGSFYAVSDQTAPTIATLSQAFTTTGSSRLVLSFQMTIQNRRTEDLQSQYARVDIMRAGAPAASLASADVVRNLFLSGATTDWTSYTFDLSDLAAGSYSLRFYQNDQNYYFQQGVDNVSLDVTTSVPEPATWALMMLGFGGIGYAMRRKNKAGARIRFA